MSVDPKWIRNKDDKEACKLGYWFDELAGARVINFIHRYCSVPSGPLAKQPLKLIDWQQDLIMRLFGWKKPDSDLRRFNKCILSIAKKNGKSWLQHALSLWMLLGEGEESATCISAACDRKQAGYIFEDMRYSCTHNEELKAATHIVPTTKTIKAARNATYRAISADSSSAEGERVFYGSIDEIHAFKSPKLWNALQYSTISHPNGMLVICSTAGNDKGHFFYDMIQTARKGGDLSTLFVCYEASSENCPIDDEREWARANPSLGITIPKDKFKEQILAAKGSIIETLKARRYLLNTWVTFSENPFIDLDKWDSCKGPFPDGIKGQPGFLGMDLASSVDTVGLALVVPHEGKYYVRCRGFVSEAGDKKRREGNKIHYHNFMGDKSLLVQPGDCIDYRALTKQIQEWHSVNPIKLIVADPYQAPSYLQELQNLGFSCFKFIQINAYYNDPVKKLEELTATRSMVHSGELYLRWCLSNVVLNQDVKGLVRPDKDTSSDKIDGACALLMALSQAVMSTVKPQSVYERRGIVWLD